MLTMNRTRIVAVFLGALALLGSERAYAQLIFDHLQCFRITDSLPRGISTADLTPEQIPPFVQQLGCRIRRPARLFCIDVDKSNVSPPPPSMIRGTNNRDFLCYRLTCPGRRIMSLPVEDQFGPRTIVVRNSQYLCVPAIKSGVPPAATPTPSLAPTPTPQPTVTACPQQCVGGTSRGLPCVVNGDCPGGTCTVPPCCCAASGAPACTVDADCAPFGTVCTCP